MQKQFPMTSVPNMQGYPENGYPVAAYYGIDSTLTAIAGNSASGNAASSNSTSALVNQIDPTSKFRQLTVVLLVVVAAYMLWHFYTK